jgi:hypothetical protein
VRVREGGRDEREKREKKYPAKKNIVITTSTIAIARVGVVPSGLINCCNTNNATPRSRPINP